VTELATIHHWPQLDRPVLVVAMEGWVDAGFAAATATANLLGAMPNEVVATFDPDELIDFRARRPTLRIVNGVDTELRWSAIRLLAATNHNGRTVLILTGPEPDMRWHSFIAEVVQLTSRLEATMVVGLGAFPAPVPHTRPVRLVGTSTETELAGQIGFLPATIDVPAGVQGALEYAFGEAKIPAVGLWARVPHYASAMPYPAAAAALLDGLARTADLELDTSSLHTAAASTHQQIEKLIAGSEEHAALVRQLEAQQEQEQGLAGTAYGDLPSGDELAAELERFLRGEH
jgi:predicted ATP-grasp superfamily ATP-dependent carboligase